MEEHKLYVVYYGNYGHISDIEAVFDSMDKVNAFKRRFLYNQQLHVAEIPFNPSFFTDPTRTPFAVEFPQKKGGPLNVTELSGISECELAFKEVVRTEDKKMCYYLLAKDSKEAVGLAEKKRLGSL